VAAGVPVNTQATTSDAAHSQPDTGPDEAVREQALRWLARREYARGELQRRLRAKGYPGDSIDDCLDALEQAGLQSDRRFTEEYIRMRHRRGYGPLRITAELGERGIARRLIDEQLGAYTEQRAEQGAEQAAEPWAEQATHALQKRYPEPPPDLRERIRRERFLRNRGFSTDQVKTAMCNYSPQCQ